MKVIFYLKYFVKYLKFFLTIQRKFDITTLNTIYNFKYFYQSSQYFRKNLLKLYDYNDLIDKSNYEITFKKYFYYIVLSYFII